MVMEIQNIKVDGDSAGWNGTQRCLFQFDEQQDLRLRRHHLEHNSMQLQVLLDKPITDHTSPSTRLVFDHHDHI